MTVTISDRAPLNEVTYEQLNEVAALKAVAIIDGLRYDVVSAEWTENAHGATDTLSVVIPLSTSPDFPVQLLRDTSAATSPAEVAASMVDVVIELWAGFPQNETVASTSISQLQRVFLGEVDQYSGDFGENTVTFSCRSLAARLVDDRLTAVSISQTVGAFLIGQAGKYGLPAPVINVKSHPATIQEVLAYDEIGGGRFAASLYGMHPWDLAIRGAQVDDTDVWVDVRTAVIHYEAPSLVDRGAEVMLKYGRDWLALRSYHSPQFSSEIEVHTHSVQPRTRVQASIRFVTNADGSVTATRTSSIATSAAVMGTSGSTSSSVTHHEDGTTTASASSGSSTGGAFVANAAQGRRETAKQIYPLYVGNVSPERANIIGEAYRRQLSQHEFAIEGDIPITNRLLQSLSVASLLVISGAPWSATNAKYYPRSITHRISSADGWRARVHALTLRLAGGAV